MACPWRASRPWAELAARWRNGQGEDTMQCLYVAIATARCRDGAPATDSLIHVVSSASHRAFSAAHPQCRALASRIVDGQVPKWCCIQSIAFSEEEASRVWKRPAPSPRERCTGGADPLCRTYRRLGFSHEITSANAVLGIPGASYRQPRFPCGAFQLMESLVGDVLQAFISCVDQLCPVRAHDTYAEAHSARAELHRCRLWLLALHRFCGGLTEVET